MLRRLGITVLLPGIILLLFGLRTVEQDRLTTKRVRGVIRQYRQRTASMPLLSSSGLRVFRSRLLAIG